MKLKAKQHNSLVLWLISAVVLFQLFSCSGDDNDVMSRSKMKRVLVDVHLLEGVFATQNPPLSEREQVYYYHALFRKHNTTKEAFDSTLAYFTRKPKSFERLYIRVLNDLNSLNDKVLAGKFHPVLPDSLLKSTLQYDIWRRSSDFVLDNDSLLHLLKFSISDHALMTQDIYHWRFRIRISPRDSSEHIYAALRLHYANGEVDSVIHPLQSDSLLRRYRFVFPATRLAKVDSITGAFVESAKFAGIKQVWVDSISLKREYLPALQDSLRLKFDSLAVGKSDSLDDIALPEELIVEPQLNIIDPDDMDRLPQRDPRRIRRAEDGRIDDR